MILGLDTAGGQCAVALVAPSGEELARLVEPMARGHAERLFPMIEEALAEAGAGFADISRIGGVTGPGSFAGVRVGVAAARGLALGTGAEAEAVGISRFEALGSTLAGPRPAATFRTEPRPLSAKTGWAERRPMAVAIAGPRESAFLQLLAPDLAPLTAPERRPLSDLADRIPETAVRIGDAWGPDALLTDALPDPAAVARLAASREGGLPPAPLYLREPDAAPPREAPPVLLD